MVKPPEPPDAAFRADIFAGEIIVAGQLSAKFDTTPIQGLFGPNARLKMVKQPAVRRKPRKVKNA
jgi:hypothetical protein